MEDIFKSHMFVSAPSKKDLIKFLGEQKLEHGAQKFCEVILRYISDFPGFYKIIGKGTKEGVLELKKLKKQNSIDFNYHNAEMIFLDTPFLSANYTEQNRCLVNIALGGKEKRAVIEKEKKKYWFYIDERDSPSE